MPAPPTEDPMVSAEVVLRPPDERDNADAPSASTLPGGKRALLQSLGITLGDDELAGDDDEMPSEMVIVDRVKVFFTRAGFEVHAPMNLSFSIGGRRSQFEDFFDVDVVVDETTLLSGVTLEDGSRDLPLDDLPPDIRGIVEAISFPAPPELPSFLT